jgi:hypothetical protein
MKMVHVGLISTGLVIAVGLAIVIPAFTQQYSEGLTRTSPRPIMLIFSINNMNSSSIGEWCNDLSSTLTKHNVKATIFLSGLVAENNPQCITSFSEDVDIGSQTYSYANLTAIADYTRALEEVKKGKDSIDRIGNLDSKLFRAPYMSTDENIYSLLSRNEIVADFSYSSQYNKYEKGLFIRYDAESVEVSNLSKEELSILLNVEGRIDKSGLFKVPLFLNFGSSAAISDIDSTISTIQEYSDKVKIVNASELIQVQLTARNGVER